MPRILRRPGRRYVEPFRDGIHLDFARGVHYIKAAGLPATVAPFTSLFTFTGGNQSMYRGANGLLVASATNTPRIEYDANGNLLGLLIEGARTNLCLQSQDIATTWANNLSSESTNTIAAPDGTTTADTLIEDNTNGQHYVTQSITIAASALTVSAFFKAKERSFAVLSINDGTTECVARYDLTTGTVGTVDATLSGAGSIQAYANGWYRCILRVTAANTAGVFRLAMTTTSSGYGYQGDGASGIYVWGAQVEQAAFASSYIPTTTGSVARTADQTQRTFGSEYISTAGTSFVEADLAAVGYGTTALIFSKDTNSRHLYNSSASAFISTFDGTVAVNATSSGPSAGVRFKAASSFDAGGQSISFNGGAVATGAYDGDWGAGTTIAIGTSGLFGHIRRLDYWPERKANAELQRLTS